MSTHRSCMTFQCSTAIARCACRLALTHIYDAVQFKLMTSWALVADVYFLPPQNIREGESAVEFAGRVQQMIADVAKLRPVPWDGYLKYYSLAEKVRTLPCSESYSTCQMALAYKCAFRHVCLHF